MKIKSMLAVRRSHCQISFKSEVLECKSPTNSSLSSYNLSNKYQLIYFRMTDLLLEKKQSMGLPSIKRRLNVRNQYVRHRIA